jgi:hypothetical protein
LDSLQGREKKRIFKVMDPAKGMPYRLKKKIVPGPFYIYVEGRKDVPALCSPIYGQISVGETCQSRESI